LELAGAEECERILDAKLGYTPAAGTPALREAIAEMQGVQPDEVQVTTGAAEARCWSFFRWPRSRARTSWCPRPGFRPSTKFREGPRGPPLLPAQRERLSRGAQRHPRSDRRPDQTGAGELPHNPTGATFSDAEMQSLHDFLAARGIQFVVDEVITRFIMDRLRPPQRGFLMPRW